MTEFQVRLPYHSRQDPLDIDALDAASAFDGEERQVAERVIWEAMIDPKLHTVGDLLDRLEQASPEEARRIADEAREAAGAEQLHRDRGGPSDHARKARRPTLAGAGTAARRGGPRASRVRPPTLPDHLSG